MSRVIVALAVATAIAPGLALVEQSAAEIPVAQYSIKRAKTVAFPSTVLRQEVVGARLINPTPKVRLVSPGWRIERLVGVEWVLYYTVGPHKLKPWEIRPGKKRQIGAFTVPPDAPPGEYRFVHHVWTGGLSSKPAVVTAPFVVQVPVALASRG